jgi:hypothetical protein
MKLRTWALIGLASVAVPALAVLGVQLLPEPEPPREPTRPAPAPPDPTAFRPVKVSEPYLPVNKVPVAPAAEAGSKVADGDAVVGVVAGGEARAYPVAMIKLISRELLNDSLGGRPILVSWCNRCQTARAFSREVDGQERHFFVIGLHWNDNMVMGDVETGTLWSQLLGRAMEGPLKGKELEPIATTQTDWKSWKAEHPETTVLAYDQRSADPYLDPFAPDQAGRMVLGALLNGSARAWPLDRLRRQSLVNDEVGGRPVLVAYLEEPATALLYARKVDDRVLTFRRGPGGVVDEETGTAWDLAAGRGVSGPLAGRRLELLPGFLVRRNVWDLFHPATPGRPASGSPAPASAE